jgi:hypothetical protein
MYSKEFRSKCQAIDYASKIWYSAVLKSQQLNRRKLMSTSRTINNKVRTVKCILGFCVDLKENEIERQAIENMLPLNNLMWFFLGLIKRAGLDSDDFLVQTANGELQSILPQYVLSRLPDRTLKAMLVMLFMTELKARRNSAEIISVPLGDSDVLRASISEFGNLEVEDAAFRLPFFLNVLDLPKAISHHN